VEEAWGRRRWRRVGEGWLNDVRNVIPLIDCDLHDSGELELPNNFTRSVPAVLILPDIRHADVADSREVRVYVQVG
jgi:hypothetical protein